MMMPSTMSAGAISAAGRPKLANLLELGVRLGFFDDECVCCVGEVVTTVIRLSGSDNFWCARFYPQLGWENHKG